MVQRLAPVLAAMVMASFGVPGAAQTADLSCRLLLFKPSSSVAASSPQLRFELLNHSPRPVRVLNWGTPFEGWFQPFLRITRDGVELPYQGPTVKRGDPQAEDYLRLAPGAQRGKTFSLFPAFEVSAPGVYRIEPRIVLHDVMVQGAGSRPPRPRSGHSQQPLDCPALEFTQR